MKLIAFAPVALTLACAPASFADVHVYEIQSMSVLDLEIPNAVESEATDVNDDGRVVGWNSDSAGIRHGFLYRLPGKVTNVTSAMNQLSAEAQGINNSSEVVGFYNDGPNPRAFFWSDVFGLQFPDGVFDVDSSVATAINDNSRIAGTVNEPAPGCTWKQPVQWDVWWVAYEPLFCASGYLVMQVNDVDESAAVAGTDTDINFRIRAYRWNGTKTWVPLISGAASDSYTYGNGINNSGAVVGQAEMPDGNRAFYWNGVANSSISLGTLPGGSSSSASEINDQNFVAGRSQTLVPIGGQLGAVLRERAFIWHAHFGMVALPILPGPLPSQASCRANAISARNNTTGNIRVVGYCTDTQGKKRAVRWTVKAVLVPVLPQ